VEPAAPLDDRSLGRLIAGKYQLVEITASGAFGTVFKAHQHFCGQFVRPVAVKVSHQTSLTERNAADLFSDALVLARLLAGGGPEGKQHLVQIFDMGLLPELDDRGYLVMEYVDGFPLLSHIHAAGRIGVASGLRYVKEICRGLAVVHAQGAVHRDLKPDNVLVDRRGVVRLVDFGLAAYTDPRLGFVPGSMGTFTYMAPETLLGRSTPAADVYGLGLLMYELFTGGGPHLGAAWPDRADGDLRDHLRVKEALHFAPPSEVQNEIRFDHRWLDALVLRCLDTDPARRFADAGRLLAAIEACEAGGEAEVEKWQTASAEKPAPPQPAAAPAGESDDLFREVRRLLAAKAFDQVIDRLDVHRPPEWAVLDPRGARTLRALGQAYLGRSELEAARDCLEQLRAAQKEKPVLGRQEHAAALSDLVKCYRALGYAEMAEACQKEVRGLL
jgi:serine/threonine protein kinase